MNDLRIELSPEGLEHLQDLATARLRTIAEDIAEEARSNAPVLSGTLRDSIEVQESEDGKSFDVVATAPYAASVEAGTSTHKAQPFLRSAGFKQR